MASNIQDPGVTQLLATNTTSTGAGNWYRVNPRIGPLSFQAIFTGSSAAYLGTATVQIQGSNDASNPNVTALGTLSFSTVATPVADGVTVDAAWQYVRANITALTSSTLSTAVMNQMAVSVSGRIKA